MMGEKVTMSMTDGALPAEEGEGLPFRGISD